jgi:hypothetical protein
MPLIEFLQKILSTQQSLPDVYPIQRLKNPSLNHAARMNPKHPRIKSGGNL